MNSTETRISSSSDLFDQSAELAVIVPTFNERENIPELIRRLRNVLDGFNWELIVVDDDSPDGTSEVVREYACSDWRIRLLHRVRRRGLSSACIEGMMASTSPYLAVMDADLQHDEWILPKMFQRLRAENLDLVVATRNGEGGSMGSFSPLRVLLSGFGKQISRAISSCELSDPMSGFFMLRRSLLLEVVHRLNGEGFKILLDIASSTAGPVRLGEVGYRFRTRRTGTSKLNVRVGLEYISMVLEKLSGGFIPARFLTFSAIGGLGILIHFAFLTFLFSSQHVRFIIAQALATTVAMLSNFFLNNSITFSDRQLTGRNKLFGLLTFCPGCSFGGWVNVSFADTLLHSGLPWYIAALAGITVSAGWNYCVSNLVAWQKPQARSLSAPIAYSQSVPLGRS